MTWRLEWALQGIEVISEAVVKLGSTPYIVPEDEESRVFGSLRCRFVAETRVNSVLCNAIFGEHLDEGLYRVFIFKRPHTTRTCMVVYLNIFPPYR